MSVTEVQSAADNWRRPRLQVLVVLGYYHLLLATLYWMIAPYLGDLYKANSGIDIRYLAMLLPVLVSALLIPRFSKPSDYTLALLALFTILPTFAYYVIHGGSLAYVLTCFGGFLAYDLTRRYPLNLHVRLEMRTQHVILISFFFLGIVTFAMLQNFEVNSLRVLAADLYLTRADVSEAAGTVASILNYVQGWSHSVIIPFLVIYFTMHRKWYMVAGLAAFSVLFFLVLARKAILFEPILAMGIYLALRNRRTFIILFIGVAAIIFAAAIELWARDTYYLAALLVRRTLFVPSMLNAQYHQIFSELGHVYYAHSVLSRLFDYPFQQPYQTIVGVTVFGNSGAHANTGIFGTGFMHFGYGGVLAFAALMGLAAAYIDNRPIARSHPVLTAAIVTVPTYTIFTSADLFSGMLTNGFLLALFYCTIYPGQDSTKLSRADQVFRVTT